MSHSLDQEFGPLRAFLWPIHRRELQKVVPMILILFFVCFNYSILRNLKDSLVVTASGAEVIPFIKVWVMLPMAVLLTCLFTYLSNRYSQERVFYIIISVFLLCYAGFAFVLYPLREVIHPSGLALYLHDALPAGFKGFIAMLCNWSFTGFYVMCELWSTMVLSVLFWGFANEVTTVVEARRFYGVFGIAASVAAIVAGQSAVFFTQSGDINPDIPIGRDAWEQTLMILILLVIGAGVCSMFLFRWMNRRVLVGHAFDDLHLSRKAMEKKQKLSVRESVSLISNSKYLLCIAMLVFGYNLVIHLVEVVWKDQLRLLHPLPADYNTYMNHLTSAIGLISTIIAFFIAKIIDRFGWTFTAMITPFMMLVTCLAFFTFTFFQGSLGDLVAYVGTTPLAMAVFFGASQNCLSKAAKYSVFDATKEMTFIPLSHECKLKGKAAIDGVCSRIGKSGGSLLHQGLLIILYTVSASAPYVAAVLMAVIILWLIAVKVLGKKFYELSLQQQNTVSEAGGIGDVPVKEPVKDWQSAAPQTV